MSFWVELHCDYRLPGLDDKGVRHACETLSGNSLGHMVATAGGVARAATGLMQQSRANGWRRTAKGWACPHCRSVLGSAP